MNLITLRCFGPIGLCSFVAIRRRQRGQITTGCFERGPMVEKKHIPADLSVPVKSARSFRPLKGRLGCHNEPHGRLLLTVLGGLADFERDL